MGNDQMKLEWGGVYAITIGVMALIIGEFLPVGTLTPMAKDLNVTEGMAGQAVSASAIFATVTSLFISYLTRTLNRKHVILVLTGSLTLSNFIVAFAPNFTFLIVGRILLGIAVGGMWSMAAAIALRLVTDEDGPKAVSFVFAGSSFASILAAPLGSFLGQIIGWREVFVLSGLVGLIALVWQFKSLPNLDPKGNVRLGTILELLKLPKFLTALLVIALLYSGRFASFTFLRPFLERVTGLKGDWVSTVLLIYGLSYFVGNYFSPSLIKNHLNKTLWGMPTALSLIGALIVLFGNYFYPTFILIFFWGAVFGPGAPAWSTWINKKAPEYAETGGGLFVAAIQGSAAIGAGIGGVFFDQFGPSSVMIFSTAAWFLAALIAFFRIKN
jgi:predicted MFS family arabinose efflux permease